MPLSRYRFFGPSDAARVSKLQVTAKQVVEGLLTGQHKSPHKGFSVEFSEHREYTPGDEVRQLDWRAFARTDRYYVKLYEQETNLRATLVLDTSGSMSFGGKLDYGRHLCACLAYLLSTQQDLAGFVAVDDRVRAELAAGSSAGHLDRLFRALEAVRPGKGTDLPGQLHALAERLPRRSLVVVVSDLWADPGELVRAVQHLRHRRHQGMVLHLLDRAELDLPYDGQVTLEDLETGERVQIDAGQVRDDYRRQVQSHLALVRQACVGGGAAYHAIHTDQPYERALAELLGRRG